MQVLHPPRPAPPRPALPRPVPPRTRPRPAPPKTRPAQDPPRPRPRPKQTLELGAAPIQVSAQLAYVRKTQEELGRERCSVTAGADWRQPAVQRAALAHEAARLLHALKESIAAAIRGGASAQAAWNAHLVEVLGKRAPADIAAARRGGGSLKTFGGSWPPRFPPAPTWPNPWLHLMIMLAVHSGDNRCTTSA